MEAMPFARPAILDVLLVKMAQHVKHVILIIKGNYRKLLSFASVR